jgi:sacsin
MTNEEDAKNTGHLTAFQGLPSISYSGNFPSSTASQSASSTFPLPPTASNPPHVDGTIIRLPLRPPHSHKPSSPSMESRTPQDILKLFEDFYKYDLECVLLFLKNIKQIAVYEINSQGVMRELYSTVLKKGGGSGSGGGDYVTWRCVVETHVSTFSPPVPPTPALAATSIRPTGGVATGSQGIGKSTTKSTITTWRILNCPFTDSQSLEILERIPQDCNPVEQMKWRKLNQSIRVAAPLSFVTSSSSSSAHTFVSSSTSTIESFSDLTTPADANSAHGTTFGVRFWKQGRLFHGLPLPRSNAQNWPIHVDAKFALPPSRQRIRSFHESG